MKSDMAKSVGSGKSESAKWVWRGESENGKQLGRDEKCGTESLVGGPGESGFAE